VSVPLAKDISPRFHLLGFFRIDEEEGRRLERNICNNLIDGEIDMFKKSFLLR
jgi:hypothetical protein